MPRKKSVQPAPHQPTKAQASASEQYTAKQITVLEGLAPVRKRPGMYVGNTASEGLHHLIWEVVNNSIDEAMAGYGTEVRVTIHHDRRHSS